MDKDENYFLGALGALFGLASIAVIGAAALLITGVLFLLVLRFLVFFAGAIGLG